MRLNPESMTEVTRHPAQKEWSQPVLRRLPIAATANSQKGTHSGNDGGGKGNGDVVQVEVS